jgi:glycosyltransferase involved in cell wall biosynthesis
MNTRIAMISEHASPLGCLGGADGGGQNVYVAQLATHLAALGYRVDVFTRKDDPALPAVIDWRAGVRIINVPAGPETVVAKEDLLPYMDAFRDSMLERWDALGGYDLVHANFWTSGVVAAGLKERLGVPFVITFHALSRVRRRFQGADDGFPDERDEIEEQLAQAADAVIAECPQDFEDLREL